MNNKTSLRNVLIAVFIILVYIKFVIIPLSAGTEKYRELLERKMNETDELNLIISKIKNIESDLLNLKSKYKNFPETLSLLGYIEKSLERLNLKNKVIKLNQKDNLITENQIIHFVNIQMSDLNLQNIFDLLTFLNNTGYMLKPNIIELKKDSYNKFGIMLEIQSFSDKK